MTGTDARKKLVAQRRRASPSDHDGRLAAQGLGSNRSRAVVAPTVAPSLALARTDLTLGCASCEGTGRSIDGRAPCADCGSMLASLDGMPKSHRERLLLIAKRSRRQVYDVVEAFHERAAIREYEAGKSRKEAEALALDDVANMVLGPSAAGTRAA